MNKSYARWFEQVEPLIEPKSYLCTYARAISVEPYVEIACVRIGYVMGVLHMNGKITTLQGKKIMTEFYANLLEDFENPYKPYGGPIDWFTENSE